MIPVEVVGVRIEMPSNQPIVLLKEISGTRYLPIWVGTAEATAIAFSQQGLTPQRPLTHDLLVDILEAEQIKLRSVHLTELREGIFFSDLILVDNEGVEQRVSSRPSDAVALAIRVDAPIWPAKSSLIRPGSPFKTRARRRSRNSKSFLMTFRLRILPNSGR